ncbi:C1 family peptidase [Janthinobacterium sp. PC23-8]|uniref:C1 family peptidase n=1 Tax=Janthinobacterium sp. PC23-8 TaxID=2012679 RepID=UPI0011403190|nr:C1 family peptidase [Janthinobacterium sp. PC23-8]
MQIQHVQQLAAYDEALKALGYGGEDGLEEVIGTAQVAGPELATYLGVTIDQLSAAINSASIHAASLSMSTAETIATAVYCLGYAIDDATLPVAAPALSSTFTAPPSTVNLIPGMPPVRHQGMRGTCVAHAALAAYEHKLFLTGAAQDMSEQFLYWNCKRSDGIPNTEGTWLAIAMPLLKRDGVCSESSWPYVPTPVLGNEGQGPALPGSQLAALAFRIPGFKQLSPTYVPDLKGELAANRCVAFSIPVFNSWLRNPWVANKGDIPMPIPTEIRVGGHAMCLVGYIDMPNQPELGGGRFILRNSWGATWGINSPYGSGYGTIPYAYLAKLGAEAYSLV